LVKGDGTSEPVDPAPVVPMVGANWRGSTPAMPMFKGFWFMERGCVLADSTALDRNRSTQEFTQVRPPEG
jgi:hypothetical protein